MTRWGHIAIAVMGGIAAALHVGKVPPAIPLLRDELGIDLVAAGWLMGLASVLGAVAGVFIGRLTDYLTHRWAMAAGLGLLIAGSIMGALSGSLFLIFAARALESVGLVMAAIAAPALVASSATERDMGLALGIWGLWMPAGVAAMMLISPVVLPSFGWRGTWFLAAALSLVPLVGLVLSRPSKRLQKSGEATTLVTALKLTASRPISWTLAGIFLAYSASFMAVFGFLPTMLIEEMQVGLTAASVMTAFAVLANAVGNVASGFLARWGVARWLLIAGPCVMLTLTAFGVFAHALPLWSRYGAAVLYAAAGGLLPGTVMGLLPVYAARRDLVGTFSGFVTQGSNIGQCFGPMLLASIVAVYGWSGAPYYILATTAFGFALALCVRKTEHGLAATSLTKP